MTKRLWLLLLAFLVVGTPVHAQVIPPSQTISVVDSGTQCSVTGSCAQWQIPNAAPSFTVQVTGTLTTVTLTFRGSADGVTFFDLLATKLSTGVQAATTTTTGQYAIVNPGIIALRVVGTVVTSGAANLTLTRGSASSSARAFPSFGSFATGDLLYASAANVISGLADVAAGSYLRSGGTSTAPLWSTLVLPNAAVTGDTVIASATNTYGAVTAVAAGSFFRSAGVGTAPIWSTTTWPNSATTGDLLMATSANTVGVRAAVASGQVLASAGTSTAPVWTGNPSLTAGSGGSSMRVAGMIGTPVSTQVTSTADTNFVCVSLGTIAANTLNAAGDTIEVITDWERSAAASTVNLQINIGGTCVANGTGFSGGVNIASTNVLGTASIAYDGHVWVQRGASATTSRIRDWYVRTSNTTAGTTTSSLSSNINWGNSNTIGLAFNTSAAGATDVKLNTARVMLAQAP